MDGWIEYRYLPKISPYFCSSLYLPLYGAATLIGEFFQSTWFPRLYPPLFPHLLPNPSSRLCFSLLTHKQLLLQIPKIHLLLLPNPHISSPNPLYHPIFPPKIQLQGSPFNNGIGLSFRITRQVILPHQKHYNSLTYR